MSDQQTALRFFAASLSHSSGRPVRLKTPDGKEETFTPMGDYITKDSGQRINFSTGARRDIEAGKGRYDLLPSEAIKRFTLLLERGAVKYGDRNWEKGIPISRCFSSALRHLFQALSGAEDEDHLAAVLFNVSAIITFRERIKAGSLPASLDDVQVHDTSSGAGSEDDFGSCTPIIPAPV